MAGCLQTVEDVAIALIHAAEAIDHSRAEADRTVVELEARWAANRKAHGLPTPAGSSLD